VFYTIRHVTRFTYDVPIAESVMEARMQPRSEGAQRCVRFGLSTAPAARVMMYPDHEGNIVHHFTLPGRHDRLVLTADALAESGPGPAPPEAMDTGAWDRVDALTASGAFWELLNPSPFARSTPLLEQFADEIGLARRDDPLTVFRRQTAEMHGRFEYNRQTTRVDSPIDDALEARRGVCQDCAHIMIALVRRLGVPCRYVSGYLFHKDAAAIRSADGATHAWVEVLLPDLGWIGLDPTNNLVAGPQHIRVAVGRDYTDVPPTRGVFKGAAAARSELAVAVTVGPAQTAIGGEVPSFVPWMSQQALVPRTDDSISQQQQ
jgi:transglutaminase-like putative cysteine protease